MQRHFHTKHCMKECSLRETWIQSGVVVTEQSILGAVLAQSQRDLEEESLLVTKNAMPAKTSARQLPARAAAGRGWERGTP
jgi:hypothetical protein